MSQVCERFGHKYFVADVSIVKSEGKVVIHALCTSCGDLLSFERIVTKANTDFSTIEKYKRNEA